MAFDILAWGYGFALTQLSTRLLAPSEGDALRRRLESVLEEWARSLPAELGVSERHLLGETLAEPTQEARPARFQLQEVLLTVGVIPSESQWLEAFVEHWSAKRAELGNEGNAFFQLPESVARQHLEALARRIHSACQADPVLARRTMTTQLTEVLRRQEAETEERERLAHLPYYMRDLSLPAQEIFFQRPSGWEVQLFSAVLSHEIGLHSSLRRDLEGGLRWGSPITFASPFDVTRWLSAHITEASSLAHNASALFNEQLPIAFGPEGEAGDPEAVVDVARKVGDIYRRAIEWALTIRRVRAEPLFDRALQLYEQLIHDMIRQFREFSDTLASTIAVVLTDPEKPRKIELVLTLSVPDSVVQALGDELEQVARTLGVRSL